MEGVSEDFQDWEEVSQVSSDSDLFDSPNSVVEIQAHSDGLIRLDYFSLDNAGGVKSEAGSGVESDNNTSWIDPGTEANHFMGRVSGEFWSDSGSERSEDLKVGVFETKGEVGIEADGGIEGMIDKVGVFEAKGEVGIEEQVGIEGWIGEVGVFVSKEEVGIEKAVGIEGMNDKVGDCEESFSGFGGKGEVGLEESLERHVGLERFEGGRGKVDDSVKFWSDSGGVSCVGEDLGEGEGRNEAGEENLAVVAAAGGEEGKPDGDSKKEVAWWKVPIEVIKYCVFRVSPVWSFSMAAAVLGFVILGRRLYKMKRRTQSLQLKVTVDDKKVSQVMGQVAKLNEAFSVVRRVPIGRPLLPTAGVSPWPMMTMR